MKKTIFASVLAVTFILAAMVAIPSTSFAMTPVERIDSSTNVVQEMTAEYDVETTADLVKGSWGVVIIPHYYKAALGLGGSYGEGLVLRHDPATGQWYGPSFMNIAGLSYGLQIGAQSTALLLVITNQPGMEHFYGDRVKLGVDIGVSAGPVGRGAGAATDQDLEASIYSYSMSKGLFAGVSLGGSVMSTDEEANSSYWGATHNPKTILEKRASDIKVQQLLIALDNLISKAGK